MVGVAQPRRRLGERIEHGPQVEGRAANDLEHVGGGGLLLQRLPQLVEQARVLDCYDGLAGEARQQLDLLVGKRADFLAKNPDRADELRLLEHRHDEKRATACELHLADEQRIAVDIGLLLGEVCNMNDLLGAGDAPEARPWAGTDHRLATPPFRPRGWCAMQRNQAELVSFAEKQVAEVGPTNPRRIREHCLENRRELDRASWR